MSKNSGTSSRKASWPRSVSISANDTRALEALSACTSAQCLANWSPLKVSSGATITGPTGATGAWATITRSDGGVQVTYNHQPLYYFMGDAAAGDTKGQGANNKWYVAPLNGTYSAPAASASASVTSGY